MNFSWMSKKTKIGLAFIVIPGGLYALFFLILAAVGYPTTDSVSTEPAFTRFIIAIDKPISVILLPSLIIGIILLFAGDKSKAKSHNGIQPKM